MALWLVRPATTILFMFQKAAGITRKDARKIPVVIKYTSSLL